MHTNGIKERKRKGRGGKEIKKGTIKGEKGNKWERGKNEKKQETGENKKKGNTME